MRRARDSAHPGTRRGGRPWPVAVQRSSRSLRSLWSTLAACAGDATEQTDAAATVGRRHGHDRRRRRRRPRPDTTVVVPDTTVVVSDVTAQLQAVVDEAVRASASIPGLVLHVEAPGRHLDVSVAAGVADRATATPLTPDAGFRIASNTKTFTAAAILRLVEQEQAGPRRPDRRSPGTGDGRRAARRRLSARRHHRPPACSCTPAGSTTTARTRPTRPR